MYNLYGETYYHAISEAELPVGRSEPKISFTITGKGKATVVLYINGEKTGETHIEGFNYMTMGGTSFRINRHTSVNDADYASPFEYNGEIEAIVIDADAIEISRQEETQKDLHAD